MNNLRVVCLAFSVMIILTNRGLAGGSKEKLSIGFMVNTQKLYGDTRSGDFVFGGNPFVIRYNLSPNVYLESDIGYSRLYTQTGGAGLKTTMVNVGVKIGRRFLSHTSVTPLLYFGIGVFNFELNGSPRYWDGYGAVGAGTEFFLTPSVGLSFTGDFRYTTGDNFDGAVLEQGKDGFFNLSLGLNYYLGRRRGFEPEPELVDGLSVLTEQVVADTDSVSKGPEVSGPPDSTSNAASVASQHDELLRAIEEKDEVLKLLRVKVDLANKQTEQLKKQLADVDLPAFDTVPIARRDDKRFFLHRFQVGLNYFADERYADAIVAFTSILDEDLDTSLANHCWYWLGECHYMKGNYRAAQDAFQRLLNESPTSSKSEVSLVMLALSRLKSGEIIEANGDFEELLEKYPDSDFRPLAQKYLAKIENKEFKPDQ